MGPCLFRKTLDNKDINQISEPSRFCENMGLVGVPILAGSQTWFQSLLFKDFHLVRVAKKKTERKKRGEETRREEKRREGKGKEGKGREGKRREIPIFPWNKNSYVKKSGLYYPCILQ